MTTKFIWDVSRSRSIKLSQIKEFILICQGHNEEEEEIFMVKAFLGGRDSEYITVGHNMSRIEAEDFVEKIEREV